MPLELSQAGTPLSAGTGRRLRVAGATERGGVRGVLEARRRQLLAAGALLTGHQLGELGVPVVIGFAIDDALAHPRFGRLVIWLLVLAVDFLALSLFWRFGSRSAARVRFGVAHDLRSAIVARALDQHGVAETGVRGSGELLTIGVSDARRVGDATRMCLLAAAGATVLLAAIIAVATISPLLAVVVVAGAVATLLAVALLSRRVEASSHTEQEANADAAGMVVDLIAGLRVLAGLRAGISAGSRYREVSHRAVDSSIRAAQATAMVSGIAAAAVGFYLAAVGGVSAELALDGHISIGTVIAVLGLSQLLLGPLQAIAQTVPSVRRGRASAARIDAALAAAPVLGEGGDAVLPSDGDLAIEALDAPGLDGISLRIAAGTLHGLASDSPVAAQSLVDVLAGEADIRAGGVFVGGVDLAAVRPGVRRATVLVWPHRSVPLGSTIAEIVGVPGVGAQAANTAVRAAAAVEILERIPGGWEARIAENGTSLSGGERQRLALARVLAERPPVLVLHEPTSAVDAVTELQIADAIRNLRRGLTTVLVTTSSTLLAACDQVSLLVDGRLLVAGTHSELLELAEYREAVGR